MTDPNYTHILLIVDRSGSMANIANDMNGAISSFMKGQAEQPGTAKVDVITFDHVPEYPVEDQAPAELTKREFVQPRGSTALYDALGVGISRLGLKLEATSEEKRPGLVQVVVVTDGEENASHEYTAEQVKKMVTTQQESFSWNFVFLGANIDSFAVSDRLGFARAQTMNYATTGAGVNNVYDTMDSYTSKLRSSVAAGIPVAAAASANAFTDEDRDAAMEKDEFGVMKKPKARSK